MEVVTATPLPKMGGSDSPFRDHDVREWSRLDTITGALERARLETDSWTASTNDVCHRYGKVLDTRARTTLDGSLAAASRQFEVFQSKNTSGTTHVQVVKTQTVSSSRWSSKAQKDVNIAGIIGNEFESLQLAVNALDLTSQKSKASVGRSVSRRPPTRQRPRETSLPPKVDLGDPFHQHFTAVHNLHKVSRLCHQIHDTAVRHAFGVPATPSISERESGDGSASGVEIVEIESITNNSNQTQSNSDKVSNNDINEKVSLTRTKSTSSENVNQIVDKEDQSDFEDLETWRREAKVRRSLQFPKENKAQFIAKPPDLPENAVSVKKIREELEKGRRLNTALRNSSLDLVTLDQIIQSVSSNSSIDKNSSTDDTLEDNSDTVVKRTKQKKDSFVTVESIKEVKDRLRRTSSPLGENITTDNKDNINSSSNESRIKSRVKSYVYGMENNLKQNINSSSTRNSLESRSKIINGTTIHKNEDWYNRRKSYGFERVHGHDENLEKSLSKNRVESSTDSGICRSNEMVPSATLCKTDGSDSEKSSDDNKIRTRDSPNGINYGNVRKMTSIFNKKKEENGQIKSQLNDLLNPSTKRLKNSEWKSNDITKDNTKLSTITVTLKTNQNDGNEIKRHSIACDDLSYTTEPSANRSRKTSLVNIIDSPGKPELIDEHNRKTKKVEFCKTEIHFAAETGKVNIVETDEKPPPSQNFRRRRRNSGPTINYSHFANRNGLSITHFGDNSLNKNESFEKIMFGISDDENSDSRMSPEPTNYEKEEPRVPPIYGVIKNTQNNSQTDIPIKDSPKRSADKTFSNENLSPSESDHLKGILKNKPIKPKPYLLGDLPLSSDSESEPQSWNIKPPIKMFDCVHSQFKTVVNTENSDVKTKYQKSLKTVRPARFPDHLSDYEYGKTNKYSDNFATHLRVSPVKKDNRPNSWSVMDIAKPLEEKVNIENEENVWVSAKDAEKGNQDSNQQLSSNKLTLSPRPIRKTSLPSFNTSNSAFSADELSSPSLVTKSSFPNYAVVHKQTKKNKTQDPSSYYGIIEGNKTHKYENVIFRQARKEDVTNKKCINDLSEHKKKVNASFDQVIVKQAKQSEIKSGPKNVRDLSPSKHKYENVVLRQPKDSEMTYFGIKSAQKVATKTNKNTIDNKPDLIQHCNKRTPSPNRNAKYQKNVKENLPNDHIYENVNFNGYSKRKFDSGILDELTKTADQMLEALNGYIDESSSKHKFDSDDDYKTPLDTISETKSWKNSNIALHARKPTLASAAKVRVKRTSSTSSVESLSRDRRGSFGASNDKHPRDESLRSEQKQKKALSESSSTKASTKATRRIQRACSREALLQSHGSSSEDLPVQVEVPVRKPRLIKKTKTSQLAVNSGVDIKRPERGRRKENVMVATNRNVSEERVVSVVPELKHKTALSAVRNISMDKSRPRSEDRSSKYSSRKESSKGTITSSSRSASKQSSQPSSRHLEPSQKENTNVTHQHRISTANIKKCKRAEGTRIKH